MAIKRILAIVAACSIALALSGCGTRPTKASLQRDTAEMGEPPTAEQAETVARSFLYLTLKDPESIKQFQMTGGPLATSWYRGVLNGGGRETGWVVCYEYNAKNGYGGYVGVKRESLVLRRSGDAVSFVEKVNWQRMSARC